MNLEALELPIQKAIDLGAIDKWLRGMADITPRTPASGVRRRLSAIAEKYDLNTHRMSYVAFVDPKEISSMVGFRKLLQTCSANNIRVDIDLAEGASLRVRFSPESEFSESLVFGARYNNVVPLLLA